VTELADQDQIVLSGRLSTATQRWLAGHMVQDIVVFPGTGFIDLILQAGQYTDCRVIDELALHTDTIEQREPTAGLQDSVF
jgi:acyl transferase domain-containing protein